MAHDGQWDVEHVTRQDSTQPHAERECARPLGAHCFHIYSESRWFRPPFLKVEIDRSRDWKMGVRARQRGQERVTQGLLRFLAAATPTSTLIRLDASKTSMRLSRSSAFGDASGKSLLSGYVRESPKTDDGLSEVQFRHDVTRRLLLDAVERLRERPRHRLRRRAGDPAA